MKKLVLLLIIALISCEEEAFVPPAPSSFQASDGTAVGAIHIDFTPMDGEFSVLLERRDKGDDNWVTLTSTSLNSFEDNHGYFNTGMPAGKVFEYRLQYCCYDEAPYSIVEEGYAYNIKPVTDINITTGNTSNLLRWDEQNLLSFINDCEIKYDVYRSEDSLGTYRKIGTADLDKTYFDDLTYYPELQNKDLYYRIDVSYQFELNLPSGGYHWEMTTPVEGDIVRSKNGDNNPILEYSIANLGQVPSSSQGLTLDVLTKLINNTVYLGVLKDASAAAIGKPALYKLNGATWEDQWVTIPEVKFTHTNFAINSTKSYLAGISDSLCVYEWDGTSWSENLTPDNLGKDDRPSAVSVAVYNTELYMAIKQAPDYDLQVLKWDGTTGWDTIGGDASGKIATGSVFDIVIENINGMLYLSYYVDDNLFIKHLNGLSWDTDLEWTQEWLGGIDLNKFGSDLYFSARTMSTSYKGGAYKVTSTTTVENLIPDDAEWFTLDAYAMAIDSDGNIILSTEKVESAEVHYPALYLFDGTSWNTVSGDFSNCIRSVGIETIGTDIYYIYGDAATKSGTDPTVLLSSKFSK